MKTAIVLGATGLVGSALVQRLIESPAYASVVLLNRRASGIRHDKVVEKIIDFDAPDLREVSGDDFFCAFGTTSRKAGSEAGLLLIDCEYPARIAAQLKAQGVRRMFLVSSVGADLKSSAFYLRTKARLERRLTELGFDELVIARPSFLLGRQGEFRLGEELAMLAIKLFAPLMRGVLSPYRAIEAAVVARSLVRASERPAPGVRVMHFAQMQAA